MKTLFAMTMLLVAGTVSLAHAQASDKTPQVTYFDAKTVTEAFVKGKTLMNDPAFKVMVSHRNGPGQVEVHAHETDVFYIVSGTATFVTGGTVPDLKETSPGQSRGTKIDGGQAHQLSKGDVIIIPEGIPHWFKEVPGEFEYFVVKSVSPSK